MLEEKNVDMIESVLSCPERYIGSVEKHTETLWVYENNHMIRRDVTYVPGLYKIFDEILDNNPMMDLLKVHINLVDNSISVYFRSTGDAIPVLALEREGKKIYVPELIFGNFFNYHPSDNTSRIQRAWLGAKLANMFSSEFIVETADEETQYKQVFSDNMTKKSRPTISKCENNKRNWTRITFKPDLDKFSMTALNENDVVALMEKRVIDIAGCLGKSVEFQLNKETRLYHFDSFSEYCQLYMKSAASSGSELLRFEEVVNDTWHICITRSHGQFQQVSFVNSTATIGGGTHVDYVIDKITSHLVSVINKKYNLYNGIDVKPDDVKNHLWVFVKVLIHKPLFDSPTKERLMLDAGSLGTFTPKFLDKVAKLDIMKNIEEWAACQFQEDLLLKVLGRHQDAMLWGRKSGDCTCTLFLTRGNIATGQAIAGRHILGIDCFGVYPLAQQLLFNVKEASDDHIMQNAELTKLMYILGLQIGVKYDDDESRKSLKYGRVIILTDQNHDGSYVMGLLINLFHTFWPELLKVPFLHRFITPIINANHTDGKTKESFYTMPQYLAWKESLGPEAKNWTVKYYEGLASFTLEEVKEYFRELDKHKRHFVWENDEDGEAIELAFSKKKITARRNWLQKFVRGIFLDPTEVNSRYRDFVNKELVYYFIKDHERSIPSIVDGLKSGEREILLYLFKKNSEDMIQVAEICSSLSRFSPFYNKEMERLENIAIGMAQDFVGSNNINLLLPNDFFGSRFQGGKDHDEPMYLLTNLSPIARILFHKEEDLFTHSIEDEPSVLRNCYVPIIPMVLVNGSEGTGSLWSSSVPKYNPLHIIQNIKRLLGGGGPKTMVPWYKGFKGSIQKNRTEENNGASFTTSGEFVKHDDKTFEITELPIGMWIYDYQKFLDSVPLVKEFRNSSIEDIVDFSVTLSEKGVSAGGVENEEILKKFNLTSCVGTTNMHLFDSTGVIKKYETPEEILQDFIDARLKIYEERKDVVSEELGKCMKRYDRIKRVMYGSGKKMADLLDDPLTEKKNNSEVAVAGLVDDEDMESVEKAEISTLENLREEKEKLEKLMEYLQPTIVKSLWMKKLEALEEKFGEELASYNEKQERLRRDHHTEKQPSAPQKKAPSDNTGTETEQVGEIKKPRCGIDVPKKPIEKQPIKRGAASSVVMRGGEKKEDGAIGMKRRGRPSSEQSPHIKKVRKSGSIRQQ